MPALGQRVRTCAFLGDSGGPAQFRINLRICLGKRLDDLLRIILVHNVDRLFFAGSVGVIKLWSRRRESQRHGGTRANCRGSQDNKCEGEKFWHKARVLSSISAILATDFFQQRKNFSFDLRRMYEGQWSYNDAINS